MAYYLVAKTIEGETLKTEFFLDAFNKTMEHEGWGKLSNHPADPGQETFSGISRVYWPMWIGWQMLDRLRNEPTNTGLFNALMDAVEEFYLVQFWLPIQGDAIAALSIPIAQEVFDTCVNVGLVRGATYLQEGLNLLNLNARIYPDLLLDGKIGPKTISTLNRYLESRPPSREKAEARLLRIMNCLQGCMYIEKMRKYPEREEFRGWFDRI